MGIPNLLKRIRVSMSNEQNEAATGTSSWINSAEWLAPAVNEIEAHVRRVRQDKIAEIAYHLWEQSGYQHGNDQDHWQEAERHYWATVLSMSSAA